MKRHVRRTLANSVIVAVIAAGACAVVLASATRTAAQTSAATKTFADGRYNYSVALPVGCRHEEGPGTLDAVCAPDLDAERSAQSNSATALLMEVSAEIVADDAGRTASELAQRYDEAAFQTEVPQSVCGESDPKRVRINNVKQTLEESRVSYTADVICAEVRFLQVAERRASARYIIGPDARYRLVARAPIEDFEKHAQAIEAFFESFRILPARKQNQ
jgi:hypothetical protein